MKLLRVWLAGVVLAASPLLVAPAFAQENVQDTFTGGSASNSWIAFDGACLTAGTSSASTTSYIVPACKGLSYYGSETQYGLTSNADSTGSGALRLTNGGAYLDQDGGIISTTPFSSGEGVQVTFTTYTYGGNSFGNAANGADGIGFYLIDASYLSNIQSAVSQINSCTSSSCGFTKDTTLPWYFGSFGGSLGYSCSQDNSPYNGMNGAYMGLGIDEYGNFLNKSDNTNSGATSDGAYSSSGTYRPERIGIRGYGNISYASLKSAIVTALAAKGITTTTSSISISSTDVYNACSSGGSWSYTYSTGSGNKKTKTTVSGTLPDYSILSGAYYNLPTTIKIANESAKTRTSAVPISYSLQITQDGHLSFSYSYNGGTYTPVLTDQDIRTSNGTLPSSLLFGFGASTGSGNNVHEITCFQASPASTSASSAAINIPQTEQVETGTEIYLAYYHTNNWWGELEAVPLTTDSAGDVTIGTTAYWDASCVLTGGSCSSTGTTVTAQATRLLLTSAGTGVGTGIDFSNSSFTGTGASSAESTAFGKLTSAEQTALNASDKLGSARLAYISGDRSNEYTDQGTGEFRARTSLLGDIIDSSPAWVGAPSSSYPDTWSDSYNSATAAENATGAQKYSAYESANATRLDVVYEGSNDGFLHGFETGSYDSNGDYVNTNNDGKELLAYMPATVMQTIHSTTATADYSSVNYAHAYFTDATPGTGDLFYGNAWHTWLVGGLGPGGNAIYALDVTTPTSLSATNTVVGEWNTSSLTCANISNCASYLGQTYGTPAIRRFHNGEWGIVFGNGLNSSAGHAGIFVMLFKSASQTGSVVLDGTYFLDTGVGSASGSTPYSGPDGIAFVTPADLDGDHITDYVYAGDMYGNVWRFDLTSSSPASWAVTKYSNTSNGALFTTPVVSYKASGSTTTSYDIQPIFTQVLALSVAPNSSGTPRVMIEFGTGSTVPQSSTADVTYAAGQQALYGIWDWYQGVSGTPGADYVGLSGSSKPSSALSQSNLQVQTITTLSETGTGTITGYRTLTNNTTCYVGETCSSGTGTVYGWYINLPGYTGVTSVGGANQTEQVIYSPVEEDGAFIVDTTIPANNSPLTCSSNSVGGWTMAVDPSSGGEFTTSFFSEPGSSSSDYTTGTPISGVAMSITGSASVVSVGQKTYLVGNTSSGTGAVTEVYPSTNTGERTTWIQLH